MTKLSIRLAALAVALGAGGCGLISSDVTDFNLDLPDKMFSVDATGWQVDPTLAQALLSTSCTTDTLCSSAAMQACPMDCTGSCNMTSHTCQLSLDVSLYRTIDLVTEKPELASINNEPVIKVTIDSLTYRVPMNTLTVDTPELGVYVAPMLVMDPKDPQAKRIGTIPPVPAGQTIDAPLAMTFTPTGKADLVATMNNYKTPFNFIVGSALVVQAGQSVPDGKLDALIHIKAHAGI